MMTQLREKTGIFCGLNFKGQRLSGLDLLRHARPEHAKFTGRAFQIGSAGSSVHQDGQHLGALGENKNEEKGVKGG